MYSSTGENHEVASDPEPCEMNHNKILKMSPITTDSMADSVSDDANSPTATYAAETKSTPA